MKISANTIKLHSLAIELLITETNRDTIFSLKKILVFINIAALTKDYSLLKSYCLLILKKNSILHEKKTLSVREFQENNLILLKLIQNNNSWLGKNIKNKLIASILISSSKIKLRRLAAQPDYFENVDLKSFKEDIHPIRLFNEYQLKELIKYGFDLF